MSARAEELAALRATIRDVLARPSARAAVRATIDEGAPLGDDPWRMLAEVGVFALGLDGAEPTADAEVLCAAAEELAAGLAPGLATSSMLAGAVLAATDGLADARDAIASGIRRAAVVLPSLGPDRAAPAAGMRLTTTDGVARLDGVLERVLDAADADALVLVAADGDGHRVCVVDLRAPGVDVTVLDAFDRTRRPGRIALRTVPVDSAPLGSDALDALAALAAVVVAAEQTGLLRATLEWDAGYARHREAFGRVIGSYQAVKHHLAELATLHEQCLAQLERGRLALALPPAERLLRVATMQCVVGPAAVHGTTEGLRILGAIGFTWQHDAHVRLRRARADEFLQGDPYDHRLLLESLLRLTDRPVGAGAGR
jgi:alkylation response protein AidB-like acyl-CoA dehydrogenase